MRRKKQIMLSAAVIFLLLVTVTAGSLNIIAPPNDFENKIHLETQNRNYRTIEVRHMSENGLSDNSQQAESAKEYDAEGKENTLQGQKALTDNAGEENEENLSDADDDNEDVNDNLPSQNPFEQSFEELAEDAYVQQTMYISDLLDELGLESQEQLLRVTNVTSGESVQIENAAMSLLLSTKGTTIIQIKYLDSDGIEQKYIKKIKYERPEASTPPEKKPLIQTNIKEQGIYNQPILNFDVWVTDYRGKTLSYSDMTVLVNGKEADYIGEMGRQTYSTELLKGANSISIRVTDEYQYTVTKLYTVFYESGSGEITISLEAGTIGIEYLVQPKKIKVESGVSLAHVLDEYLKDEGFTYNYTGSLDDGFYLAKITKKDQIKDYKIPKDLAELIEKDGLLFDENRYESLDCLGEFDFCQGSGWMYSINDLYSSYGFTKAYVQDGDTVRIRFTLAYGKDIGGYSAANMAYGRIADYGKEW